MRQYGILSLRQTTRTTKRARTLKRTSPEPAHSTSLTTRSPLNRKQVARLITITDSDLASSVRYLLQKFVGGLKRSTVSVSTSESRKPSTNSPDKTVEAK